MKARTPTPETTPNATPRTTPDTLPAESGGTSGRTSPPARPPDDTSVSLSRAARELDLKRGELALAVQLGYVRTARGSQEPGERRVPRAELDRLHAAQDDPDTLRERVRLVGTTEGAALIGITKDRFTKLARAGLLTPAKFYLNRYRTVVWLYLADDVRQFADANPTLLSGRVPEELRKELAEGQDQRARNWRCRRTSWLLHLAEGPWQRAAVLAAMLDPAHIAEYVPDPYERSYLSRQSPDPTHTAAGPHAPAVLLADDPDEIRGLRAGLSAELAAARELAPAPRPKNTNSAPPTPAPPRQPATRGLFARLTGGSGRRRRRAGPRRDRVK